MNPSQLKEQLLSFCVLAKERIVSAASVQDLEQMRPSLLGKASLFHELAQHFKDFSNEQRRELGVFFNQEKSSVEQEFLQAKSKLMEIEVEKGLESSRINLSLPTSAPIGSPHPTNIALQRITSIFQAMGFAVQDAPEVEHPDINFGALNMPEFHPARSMQDTFYLRNNYLLRTHTSNIQVHAMRNDTLPLRILSPGKVFRSDSDQTHSPMFHQVEGLYIDENVTFSQLLWTLQSFLSQFFASDLKFRFRPSYFPFTQPSVEVDIAFEQGDFIEVLGCGMVHPSVLESSNIDSKKYTGFAFGLGVERFAMLANNLKDLRPFFDSKQPWLASQKRWI